MKPQLIIKAIFFTLLIPGAVTIYVPFLILGSLYVENWSTLSALRVFAILIGVIAGGILLHCIWEFAFYGKGTLAPIHPPESLVVRGLYRYTRNPMYLAVLVVLLTETLFFSESEFVDLHDHYFLWFPSVRPILRGTSSEESIWRTILGLLPDGSSMVYHNSSIQ